MKNLILYTFPLFFLFLSGCKSGGSKVKYAAPDWNARKIKTGSLDSLKTTRTYLPVYAQIYHNSGEEKVDLAVTISIRNTDINENIFFKKIDYYNTEGKLIRKYLDAPIYIKPAETIEIIIKSSDNEGGTGANFVFEWAGTNKTSKPLFESVMISTMGQQGIAFTCRGVDLN